MPDYDIPFWWCCVAPPERTIVSVVCEAMVITLGIGIPYDIWLATWLVTGADSEARRDAALNIYGFEVVTIAATEEVDASAVVRVTDVGFAVAIVAYLLDPASTCVDGCRQSVLPTP